ncbi:MAG: hypothetical protein OEV78_02865 [Spirochaetia bacterium]|nr:hypothetical protein [Spirochaetia bacterium]
MKSSNSFTIRTQPDDTTCGPTCLQSVYSYYHDHVDLMALTKEVRTLKEGGTLSVMLGIHALNRGYHADIYTYNLRVFDPTWAKLSRKKLIEKLTLSYEVRTKPKLRIAIKSYIKFLNLGGNILFDELSPDLIKGFLKKKIPVLTGLSSTYLYKSKREYGYDCTEDDIKGDPCGHFVVLYDYVTKGNNVKLADPWIKNPFGKTNYYEVSMQRLINSILLGVLTYDSNLLILTPAKKRDHG